MAKSPTMAHLEPVLGKRSIVTAQVSRYLFIFISDSGEHEMAIC